MSEQRTAMRRHLPISNSQGLAGVGALLEMKCGSRGGAGRRVNKWLVRGGGGLWHLLSGDQTAALKHAELISIVMSQARLETRLRGDVRREFSGFSFFIMGAKCNH